MKIEIKKVNGISKIFLDEKPVENGCMGFEVSSAGSGFATITLKFITRDLDIFAEVDNPIMHAQKN